MFTYTKMPGLIARVLGKMTVSKDWFRRREAPFDNVWDKDTLKLQRQLVDRICGVAEQNGIKLFLFWGTLLGQVREGRILPWDDDVDLALIGADSKERAKFRAALQESGLETHDLNPGERIIKVCDPAYPHPTGYPWTWPFVDIFPYHFLGEIEEAECDPLPVPRDWVLPGRRANFEGAQLWEPENSRAVLDRLYPDWREQEISPSWDHRRERPRPEVGSRKINTDTTGRKIYRS